MRTSPKKAQSFFKDAGVSFTDSTIAINEHSIHYIQTGSDDQPSLVFIHGSPGSWDAWKAYLKDADLHKKFRLIAPDRPGFGFSNFRKSANLAEQATLLNTFIAQLANGKPMTLIGHSYGGPLIVKMALERPELYTHLYILAGALDPEAEKPEKWRKPLTWIPLKYLVPGALKPSNDEIWMLKQDLWELQPELKNLKQNIVIIHGTEDKLVHYSNVPYMEKMFLNADTLKIVTLKDENHFIVWNQEALIKEHLLSLITDSGQH